MDENDVTVHKSMPYAQFGHNYTAWIVHETHMHSYPFTCNFPENTFSPALSTHQPLQQLYWLQRST